MKQFQRVGITNYSIVANANYEYFSKETKVRQWAEASLGREIEEGEAFDPRKCFQNRILRVKVGDNKAGKFSNVQSILGLVREL